MLLDVKMGRPEFDSDHSQILLFSMHQEQIRRIRKPWFEYSDVEHQDPIHEREEHPMSLEASQSSRISARDLSQGVPPGQGFMSLAEWIFSKTARLRGSSDA